MRGASNTGRGAISLMRDVDYIVAYIFLGLLAASLVAVAVLVLATGRSVYQTLPLVALPLFVIGLIDYVYSRRWLAVLLIAAISAAVYFLDPSWTLVILFLFICAAGLAVMTEVIQRHAFYRVLRAVELANVRQDPGIWDRVIIFLFNIPCDLDTRNLTIDGSVKRTRIPWADMAESMVLALVLCMFLWIYMFLNPAFRVATSGIPTYTFTIMLYVALLAMPWTIFKSLNARIETDYRDFSLFRGLLETMKRMFLPSFAALFFLMLALFSGVYTLYYILLSVLMIAATTISAGAMYYMRNEPSVIDDITGKWPEFRPVGIYEGLGSRSEHPLDDGVPGTPRRSRDSCFSQK